MKEKHFHVYDKETDHDEIEHYDVCILGGGPAGLTSAIYSSRYGLHTGLITNDIGGMANLAHKIENYPGFEGSGSELMQKFHQQAKKYGTEFLNTEVKNLKEDDTGYVIGLENGRVVHTISLIIALGTTKRKLDIPGEDEFLSKGVSYCATCDANFFKGRVVSVIGGRNSAANAALVLSGIAKKVYLVYRQNKLNCDQSEKENIEKKENIELVLNSKPVKIEGDKKVEKLVVDNEGKAKELKVDGVFIEIGSIPIEKLTRKLGINTDEKGFIEVDKEMKTNVEGVFAAGDTVKTPIKQVVIAAGQGAIAAWSAKEHVK